MRRAGALALITLAACHEKSNVVDRGGRSLDVPVPSRGTAATNEGREKDIFAFPKRARQDPSSIGTRSGVYGTWLVDASGRSVYAFSGDDRGQPACATHCATVWPPMNSEKTPGAGSPGINAALIGLVTRSDGKRQVTYAGFPLYYAEADLKPGDTWGHYAMSFGGHFALVSPDGKPLPPPK